MNNIRQLQEAKSRFSELVDKVLANGVQIVTRRGQKTVAVLPYEEFERLTRPTGGLAEFLMSSPLAGSGLEIKRDQSTPRDIELEP
jgi:antitoxin Phd